MTSLIEILANKTFGMTPKEAQDKGVCIACKEPALPKCYSDAGRREYAISSLCEQCFDSMFNDEEPEEEYPEDSCMEWGCCYGIQCQKWCDRCGKDHPNPLSHK